MMWFMAKGMRKGEPASRQPEEMNVDELHREDRELDRELARLGGRREEDGAR